MFRSHFVVTCGHLGRGLPMVSTAEVSLRFIPSAVEGLPSVTEVAVFPDRLELFSEGRWVVIPFLPIARWYGLRKLYWWVARPGWGVRGRPTVADRDWFHPPAGRFFRFYTKPPITVYMPDEPRHTPYDQTMFRRLQVVLLAGGFVTNDLG